MELVYRKIISVSPKYFFRSKFEIVANQIEYFRLELGFVNKFSVAVKCKPREIYRRMNDTYGEACFRWRQERQALNRFTHFGWQNKYNRGHFWTTINCCICCTQNCAWWPYLFYGQLSLGFHQDNARSHTAARTEETISHFSWEHSPCSLDLAPLWFPLVCPPQKITVLNKVFKQCWTEEHS